MSAPKFHNFLFTEAGEWSAKNKRIPAVREFIAGMADTAALFSTSEMDSNTIRLKTIHFEFCGTWPLSEYYGFSGVRKFINPNGHHPHRYSDLVVTCECGAKLTRNYEDGGNSLRSEHAHNDGCKPYQRLEARAKMSRLREAHLKRLTAMGMTGTEIAPRLGMRPNTVGGVAKQFGTSIEALRNEYRIRAGNTYRYARTVLEVPAEDVAAVYDHERTTLAKWADDHGTFEVPDGKKFGRKENGQFGWIDT